MGKLSKRLLLCLLAVSSLTVSGSVYAEAEGSEDAPKAASAAAESAEPEKARRVEASEKAALSADDAEKYLKKIGSADGYDVYVKEERFDEKLWEAAGGKPKSKKDYTEEQQLLADKIAELKKLGGMVIID